ncbi:cell surface glycoprotein 1-like isoform X2 [Myxocyprinus asiaticus]|uniref:cell surface glycoprotein 1-like isoform X2 n=1 Tax=Myxocyprinus asiaticus TaxID=70543 RepID=UPI0022232057|nr:cell surface glycoprotein 1-like isoform X2 [Myxocyprinus asiaticus]
MSSVEGNRQSVLKTTKVRTALKGDSSWIQRNQEENVKNEEEEEKPWMAEVRANRTNGVFAETSPITSPTTKAPQPTTNTEIPTAPTSGYLIRGVFRKTDSKPTSTSANGFAGMNNFTKKPSESYKKIAPHTIRTNAEKPVQSEPTLSPEEVEKRTEAASSVLKGSATSRRSYVLSAAKKYESTDKSDSSPMTSTSFVAKRVVISDDDDIAPAKPASTVSIQSAPQQSVKASTENTSVPVVKEVKPVAPQTKSETKPTSEPKPTIETKPAPETKTAPNSEPKPMAETKTPVSKPVVDTKPAPETKTAPEPKPVVETKTAPEPKPVVEIKTAPVPKPVVETKTASEPKPVVEIKTAPVPKPVVETKTAPEPKPVVETKTASEPKPVVETKTAPEPKPVVETKTASEPKPVVEIKTAPVPKPVVEIKTAPEPKPVVEIKTAPEPKPVVEIKTAPVPKPVVEIKTAPVPKPVVETKTASEPKPVVEIKTAPEPKPVVEIKTAPVPKPVVEIKTAPEPKPVVEIKTAPVPKPVVEIKTAPEPKPVVEIKTAPVPKPTTQTNTATDHKSAPESKPVTETKTGPEPKPTIQLTTATEPKPAPETKTAPEVKPTSEPKPAAVTKTTTETKTATEPKPRSEPKPVAETQYTTQLKPAPEPTPEKSTESLISLSDTLISFKTEPASTVQVSVNPDIDLLSQDLLTDYSSLPQTKQTVKSLDLLADDIIPINTSATRISTEYTYSHKTQTVKQPEEFKSSADPFDPIPREPTKSPDWYNHSLLDSTNNRSKDPDSRLQRPLNLVPDMPSDVLVSLADDVIPINTDRSKWRTDMESKTYTKTVDSAEQKLPESEPKKGFVYVKEYVNNSHIDSSSDYLTSTTSNYNYSTPSYYSSKETMTPCTYCREMVGNDAKITIEHLNISCHPSCFKCGICTKPMGDLLYNMFLHRGVVHCESCYSNVL